MSGLLERIARRRRTSASRRLGPPPQNGTVPLFEDSERVEENGTSPLARSAPAPVPPHTEDASPTPEPVAAEPEPAPEPQAEPELEAEQTTAAPPEPEPEEPITEIVPPPAPALEPEPVLEPERTATPPPEPALESQPPPAPESQPLPAPEPPPLPTDHPTFLERGKLRRRARYLRRVRELQLRDIGGFMVELHRFGRQRPDLVEAKLAGAAQTDRELRALEHALAEPVPVRELREAGVGGACSQCGAVYGSGDRFCAWCGSSVRHRDPDHSATPEAHE